MSEIDWSSYWERIEHIFDPSRPIQDAALFAQRPQKYDSMHRLGRRLHRRRRGGQYVRELVAGTVGNGKTSALYQLAAKLSGERMVVFVDLWRHFERTVGDPNALDRLESWELIGLLGLAVLRAGTERFGHQWGDEPDTLERALATLRNLDKRDAPKLDVVELSRGMVVAAGGLAGAVLGGPPGAALSSVIGEGATKTGLLVLKSVAKATDWKWRLGLPQRQQRQDQEPEVRAVIDAVNLMIMALQRDYNRPLVLIIDGLDRVRDEQRLRALFVESSLLAELVCDEVVTGPEFMLHGLSQRVRVFGCTELCNVPVLTRKHPSEPHAPGMQFFRELVAKRSEAVALEQQKADKPVPNTPLPDAIIDRLAYYSGGVVRDFIRMVHDVAGEAWEANTDVVSDEMVNIVLDEFRGWKQQRMNTGEIALLRGVMNDPEHGLPSDPEAIALLRQLRLLPYPNDNPWYYPHPLLTLSLLKPSPGSAR